MSGKFSVERGKRQKLKISTDVKGAGKNAVRFTNPEIAVR
jgi:hypothetical protein